MEPKLTTLRALADEAGQTDPTLPLVFTTTEGDIGAGYHVTELKHMQVSSIDCGGRLSNWTETQLQLLDGETGRHMSVGKFIGIAKHSWGELPGLADAPISVEYAPHNLGLRRYKISRLAVATDGVRAHLVEDRAQCKPRSAASKQCYSAKAACC